MKFLQLLSLFVSRKQKNGQISMPTQQQFYWQNFDNYLKVGRFQLGNDFK
jgi:hypothetical protein